ncbi:MAG: hypothetical protein RBT80_01235 [Candidatus Vecturithrix sp.]|jgi:hypothetical protein|nr:hypothetical protein [Candidatus Vecturithrix sp.]
MIVSVILIIPKEPFCATCVTWLTYNKEIVFMRKQDWYRVAGICILFVSVAACQKEPPQSSVTPAPTPQSEVSKETLKKEVGEAVGATAEFMRQQAEQYRQEAEKQLQELDRKI